MSSLHGKSTYFHNFIQKTNGVKHPKCIFHGLHILETSYLDLNSFVRCLQSNAPYVFVLHHSSAYWKLDVYIIIYNSAIN